MRRKLFLISVMLILIGVSTTCAQLKTIENYNDSIGRDTKITYTDLLKEVFPAMETNENSEIIAKSSVPLNHLFGEYQAKIFENIKINAVTNLNAKLANANQILLLIDANSDDADSITDGSMRIAALFQIKPQLKLLDAADLQTDRFADVWEKQPQIAINSKENAFVIVSSHHNSTQGYASFSMIAVVDGKIKSIFDFPILLNSNWCGNAFTETPKISVIKTARGKSYFDLSVEVKLVRKASGADCEKQANGFVRYYRSRLVWNAAAKEYKATGTQLNKLGEFNEKNF